MSQMRTRVGKDISHLYFLLFQDDKDFRQRINSYYLLNCHFQIDNMSNYRSFSLPRDILGHNLWGKLLCHGAFKEKIVKYY